jgi:hypothetical protein
VSVADIPDLYGFSTTLLPIKSATGVVLAPSWEYMFIVGLDMTLDNAGVLPYCQTMPWTGCYANGTTAQNCVDWGSDSVYETGIVGSANSNEPDFLDATAEDCNVGRPIVCGCIGGVW